MKGVPSRKPGDSDKNESSMLELYLEYLELRAQDPTGSPGEMMRFIKTTQRGFIAIDCLLLKECYMPWRKRHPDPLKLVTSRMEPEGEKSLRARGWLEIMRQIEPDSYIYVEDFIHQVLEHEGRYGKLLPSAGYIKRHFLPKNVPVLRSATRYFSKLKRVLKNL